MSSILTNTSSMIALETLRGVNRGLQASQAEISSGRRVADSRGNGAVWAVSSGMTGDVAGLRTISESLALGSATVGVARSVTEKIVGVLQDIKSLVLQAREPGGDTAKYQDGVNQKVELIESYISSAQFNGLNMIDASLSGTMDILASLGRDSSGTLSPTYVNVAYQDLSTQAGGGLANVASIDVTDPANALIDIEQGLNTAVNAAAALGSAQVRIEKQAEFINTLVNSMNTGIGALTDADMEAASVRLQALQVQQQLGVQSLSIANQTPQAVLALLRQ